MIAEIKHKMVCGLEDELTGNFFGNMWYLPFSRGLKTVLSSSVRGNDPQVKKIIENIGSDDFVFEFWKRSGLGYGDTIIFDSVCTQDEEVSQMGTDHPG